MKYTKQWMIRTSHAMDASELIDFNQLI